MSNEIGEGYRPVEGELLLNLREHTFLGEECRMRFVNHSGEAICRFCRATVVVNEAAPC
jgi:hypothetical protein